MIYFPRLQLVLRRIGFSGISSELAGFLPMTSGNVGCQTDRCTDVLMLVRVRRPPTRKCPPAGALNRLPPICQKRKRQFQRRSWDRSALATWHPDPVFHFAVPTPGAAVLCG